MICINGTEYQYKHFPDGTLCMMDAPTFDDANYGTPIILSWYYSAEEELSALQYLSMHYRDLYPASPQFLGLQYIPNARMDRVKSDSQVFTLKYFARIINSLNFARVFAIDPHSDVSKGLIDRISVQNVNTVLEGLVSKFDKEDTVLYFPDKGSQDRYASMEALKEFKSCYGKKLRDFSTGAILGLEVITNGVELKGKRVIMIDDIISYGGTLYYSALKLKELGVEHIYAYATHVENSVLDPEKGTFIKVINDGTVEKLFTTDSIYSGNHEKIVVL